MIEQRHQVPAAVVERLRAICLALPGAAEEPAWVGIRWWVRRKAFAHVLVVHRRSVKRSGSLTRFATPSTTGTSDG